MRTSAYYQQKGKLVYNYITAFHPSENSTYTVRLNDKPISVDDSTPVTLSRMAELHEKLCAAIGEKLGVMRLNLSAFEPGEYDGANPKLWEKTYEYNPKGNSLVIYEDGEAVYANDDGVITTDSVALADTLYE